MLPGAVLARRSLADNLDTCAVMWASKISPWLCSIGQQNLQQELWAHPATHVGGLS
jgi:hypothetical protein